MAKTVKKLQRELERQVARREAEAHKVFLHEIVSLHTDSLSPNDWRAQADQPAPTPPTYTPTLFDRLRKREAADSPSHRRAVEAFEGEYRAWKEGVERARGVIGHDPTTFEAVIAEEEPFAVLADLGARVTLGTITPSEVELTITSFAHDVVPTIEKSILSSGRLSVRSMSKTRQAALKQDYMCSAALRAARDLMSLLPLERILVHVDDEYLDTSTGHYVERTMVSALIDRTTLAAINFDRIDPSDAIANFNHAMNRATARGMRPVERLDAMTVALTTGSMLEPASPARPRSRSDAARSPVARQKAREEESVAPRSSALRSPAPRSPAPRAPDSAPNRGAVELPDESGGEARSVEVPASLLDALDEKGRMAVQVLVENHSVSTADLARSLNLSTARVGGLMRKVKQQARAEGINLFSEEPLPNGERQYVCSRFNHIGDGEHRAKAPGPQ